MTSAIVAGCVALSVEILLAFVSIYQESVSIFIVRVSLIHIPRVIEIY